MRSSNTVKSVGQSAAKLPAIKLWEWFDPGCSRTQANRFECGQGWKADFFFRPPTLIAKNFAALSTTNPKFSAFKDLNLLKKYIKNQEAISILRVDFALSKWPHFNCIYLLRGPFLTSIAECEIEIKCDYKAKKEMKGFIRMAVC